MTNSGGPYKGQMPILLLPEDALEAWQEYNDNDPVKCFIVAFLVNEGMSNSEISNFLSIDKPYYLTHLKRVGLSLSEEQIRLWSKHRNRVTLGHVRAIANLNEKKKDELLDLIIGKKTSVRKLEGMAKGNDEEEDVDTKRYAELMGESLGREVKIKFNPKNQSGNITLSYFGLDDLDFISKSLGFSFEEEY